MPPANAEWLRKFIDDRKAFKMLLECASSVEKQLHRSEGSSDATAGRLC